MQHFTLFTWNIDKTKSYELLLHSKRKKQKKKKENKFQEF